MCTCITLTTATSMDAIERAVSNGNCLLLANIGESVDPVLDPLQEGQVYQYAI